MKPHTAKDVMKRAVLTVRDDMTLHEVATFLTENSISGAPVLDGHGKLAGVVSLTDIALCEAERATLDNSPATESYYWRAQRNHLNREDLKGLHLDDRGLRVRDIMTPAAYTIPESTPVSKIAQTMIAGRLHRLLVTRENRLVGIVTPLDLIALLTMDDEEPTHAKPPQGQLPA